MQLSSSEAFIEETHIHIMTGDSQDEPDAVRYGVMLTRGWKFVSLSVAAECILAEKSCQESSGKFS